MDSERSWVDALEAGAFAERRADADAAAAPEDLARTMAELSRYFYAADDAADACARVVEACTGLVEGCTHAAVSLTTGGRVSTPATTGPEATALEELEQEIGEGPCLQAIRDERNFAVRDLAADPRWPRYGPAAARRGVRSMVACRLFADARTIGALNVFGARVDAFDEADQDRITVLAAHAAVAIDAARTRANLQEAIRSRQVIGEAIGILKERYAISSATAFDRLATASQQLNIKLRAIAEHLAQEPERRDRPVRRTGGGPRR
ncbi:GAF and ANTAR domain-containing protein [Pseudonocardia sp. C8]|uniref:GAF and ANTAR domain-containing protein n=1 Tax=Pseudonocardia sp. C8 TaxID=2762759 RepID=UPI0016433FCA|nr:GAF and ANTAR domain-containing protein [Pseudonocardia sp. C8]MBC3193336.1 GAF and ANTAR domain-containing protein [Pseudonocardia sp. C8]